MKFGKTIHVKEPGSAIDAVEEVTISDDLTQKVSLSANEETLQLSIAYKKGKFTIFKMFANTYEGKESLEEMKKQLNNETNIRKYLGL